MKDDQLFNAIKEKKGWHSYFMALACLLSTRSKDKLWKVGACIVNAGGQVVGQGYNGMLNNAPENTFPWEKSEIKPLEDKTLFVCHAEMNALAFSNLNEFDGCTMYVSTFPCMPCAMRIKAAGISHVYFLDVQSNKGRESEVENAEDILKDLLRKSPIHESVTFDFETLKVSFTADGGAFLPDREPTGGVKKITFRVKDLNDKMVVERMRWEHFFFAICLIEAQKSSEQVKYGACVVTKDNYLVGWGHNRRAGSEPETEVHAEMMAVLRAGPALKNATLYTLQHPCNECAKSMIQRGVAKVIYLEKLLLEEPQVKKRVAEWMFREMEVFTRFYDVTIPSGVKKGKVEVTFEGRKPEAAKKGVNSGK